VAEAFEHGHQLLRDQYRSEYFYKNVIVSKLVFGRHSPATAGALLELPVNRSIADVVVLNGTTTAYEVKTDLDSFDRLGAQLDDYLSCFEHVYVVTSTARSAAATRLTPPEVGVIALKSDGALSTVRPSTGGLQRIQQDRLFELLRQGEAESVLRRAIDFHLDVPRGLAWARCKAQFMTLPIEVAHSEVLKELRQRSLAGAQLATLDGYPQSLRALAYAAKLTGKGRAAVQRQLASVINS
jgi:hypothetical protein